MITSRLLVPALSVTLITSWGSLYYAFAVLARPIQAELGWGAASTVGAYSLALLMSGVSAYPVGRFIDRHGGRHVMTLGSCLAAVLLVALSQIDSIYFFYAVWFGLGVAMAMTLYEPAFAVIVAAFPHGYRKRIGMLTLTAGLASTVFWPLTHALVELLGWRGALLVLGAIHLLLCAPLHWFMVPTAAPKTHAPLPESALPAPSVSGLRRFVRQPTFWLIGGCFIAFGLVTAALAVHVIPMLEAQGLSAAAAVGLAALIGPMQVSGRLAEVVFGTRVPALTLGAVTMLLIPLALAILLLGASGPLLYVFVVIYGAGLGLITIVRATTPAEIFGREHYASMSGALGGPAIMARAIGPLAATAMLSTFNHYHAVLLLLFAVAVVGATCYWLAIAIHRRRHPP